MTADRGVSAPQRQYSAAALELDIASPHLNLGCCSFLEGDGHAAGPPSLGAHCGRATASRRGRPPWLSGLIDPSRRVIRAVLAGAVSSPWVSAIPHTRPPNTSRRRRSSSALTGPARRSRTLISAAFSWRNMSPAGWGGRLQSEAPGRCSGWPTTGSGALPCEQCHADAWRDGHVKGSERIRTTSAVSMATSVPAPIAMPTSAVGNSGASFTPPQRWPLVCDGLGQLPARPPVLVILPS